MVLVILAGVIALQAWVWRLLVGRVRSGTLTRGRAVGRYVVCALAPAVLFVAAFLGAVWLEERLGVSLGGESLARAILPMGVLLLGLAVCASLGFAVRCAWLKRPSATRL